MRFRAFIAVEIEASPELRVFSRDIDGAGAQVKLVKLDNLHVTLKFLGDTDEELIPEIRKVMESAVEGIGPFTIELRGAGAFPNLGRPSVLWAGMRGAEPLIRLAGSVDDGCSKLGFKKEKRRFSPHITVARVKGGRNKDRLADIVRQYKDTGFGEIAVDRIILKKSVLTPQGPIYSDVETVNL